MKVIIVLAVAAVIFSGGLYVHNFVTIVPAGTGWIVAIDHCPGKLPECSE